MQSFSCHHTIIRVNSNSPLHEKKIIFKKLRKMGSVSFSIFEPRSHRDRVFYGEVTSVLLPCLPALRGSKILK